MISEFKNLLIEALRDNKKLIIGLYMLFIICFIAAWALYASKFQANFSNMTATSGISVTPSALELFIHNASSAVAIYLASLFFAIPAVGMVIFDGVNMGMIGPLFGSIMPNGGMFYIVYLIPHGIFEITGSIIGSAAGVLLFLFIFRFAKALIGKDADGASDAFEKTKKPLMQSLALLAFAIILILIAAPIEAYVSVPLAEFIFGI